jgi:hypothetical protein
VTRWGSAAIAVLTRRRGLGGTRAACVYLIIVRHCAVRYCDPRSCKCEQASASNERGPRMYEMQGPRLTALRTRRLPRRAGPPGQSAIRAQSVPPPVQDTRSRSGCPILEPSLGARLPGLLTFPELPLGGTRFRWYGSFYAVAGSRASPSGDNFQDSFAVHRPVHRIRPLVHSQARYSTGPSTAATRGCGLG